MLCNPHEKILGFQKTGYIPNQVINYAKITFINLYQFHCFCIFGSPMVLSYNAISFLQHSRGF